MPQLESKQEWLLKLETRELVLLLKALTGRLKEDDIEPARNLGEYLTRLRASTTKHVVNENDKLIRNITENKRKQPSTNEKV